MLSGVPTASPPGRKVVSRAVLEPSSGPKPAVRSLEAMGTPGQAVSTSWRLCPGGGRRPPRNFPGTCQPPPRNTGQNGGHEREPTRGPAAGGRGRAQHPRAAVGQPAPGRVRGGHGRRRAGGAGRGAAAPPRPGRARRDAARPGRLRRGPQAALGRHPDPGAVPHRQGRHRGQGDRPDHRRRRLRDQAVQPGGGDRPHPGRAAPGPLHRAAPAPDPAARGRPGAGRGEPRGLAGRQAGAALTDRVQAAALSDDQRRPGAVQGPDPRPRLELRLPGRLQHRRVLRVVPAPQGRRGRAPADPHQPQRRLRPAAARPMTLRPLAAGRQLAARTPLQVKLIAAVLALVTVALLLIGLASGAALRGFLVGRLDDQLERVADQFSRDEGRFGGPGGGPGHGPPSPYLVQRRGSNGEITDNIPADSLDEGQQPPRLPSDAAWLQAHAGRAATVPATVGGGHWRVVVQPTGDGDSVVVAASLDGIDSTLASLRRIDLVVSLVVLLVLAGVGAAIVRASLRPLVEIEQTARAIAAGDLTRRVPDRDPRTEVGRLGRALNTMLAQIESAFGARAASEASARRSEDRMRRFVADASHELRTPLTTIRGFAELYRQGGARDPAELDRLMRRIEGQAAQMGLLVEDLLLLARLDQQRPLDRRPVDLLALAAEAVNDARAVAPDRQIELVLGGEDGENDSALVVLGDDQRLRQVLANLVNNALAHTPAGSPVEVRVGVSSLDGRPSAAVEVVDHGPGLSPEQAERVFERFYRADPARSHPDGGTGLGLSIVAALVAVHGGTVQVDSIPGRGARFRVVLPLAPDAAG